MKLSILKIKTFDIFISRATVGRSPFGTADE